MTETEMTPEPICPHCGHIERDACEWNFVPGLEGEHVAECNSCGEVFETKREISICYTTYKVKA